MIAYRFNRDISKLFLSSLGVPLKGTLMYTKPQNTCMVNRAEYLNARVSLKLLGISRKTMYSLV